jgi:methionine-gamma-lyase
MRPRKLNDENYSVPTRLIYGESSSSGWEYANHLLPPITASSTFRLGSAARGAQGFEDVGDSQASQKIYVYDRLGEPANDMLAHSIAVAEQSEIGVTFATGMAAIHAATCFRLHTQGCSRPEILCHSTVYGCSFSLFSKWLTRMGVQVSFIDLTRPEVLTAALNSRVRLVYMESPVNPTLELIDLESVSTIVAAHNRDKSPEERVLTVIDNTFATPWCQRPTRFGIDIVVHSLTKGLGGFGTEMGGVVVTRKEFFEDLILFRKDFGAVLSPHSAWNILVHGIPSLALRIPKQQESAQKIAEYLEQHPAVESVRYPGLASFDQASLARKMLRDYEGTFAPGFMLYFSLKGTTQEEARLRGQRLMDYLAEHAYSITLAVSFGQLRTLIEHPASMTHSAYSAEEQLGLGMQPGGIRLAVGIERVEDLIKDLDAALKALGAP